MRLFPIPLAISTIALAAFATMPAAAGGFADVAGGACKAAGDVWSSGHCCPPSQPHWNVAAGNCQPLASNGLTFSAPGTGITLGITDPGTPKKHVKPCAIFKTC